MKKTIVIFAVILLSFFAASKVQAQSVAQDLEQLELDYQKLAGLKSILKQMYTGYEVLDKGYNSVKSIAQGNFNLHNTFLTGLMIVSPTVRKYPRALDIINDQTELVKEYQSAYSTFKQDPHFNPDEISYMMDVYNNLISGSLNNLTALTTIITDNQVRMSDAERIREINALYTNGHSQLTFLRSFNNDTEMIGIQRAEIAGDRQTLKNLYGVL